MAKVRKHEFCLGVALLLGVAIRSPALTDQEKARIDGITGTKGTYAAEEGAYKVSFPRNDLSATVDGWSMRPFMGTTSWAAFASAGRGQAIVMGDLTLAEDEVNPVMSVALDNGLEVTALHNHFFFDNPRIMFMHVSGHGTVEQLASAVRKCIDKTQEIRRVRAEPARSFPGAAIPGKSSIGPQPIESVLGAKGLASGGMLKFTFGRTARAHGRRIGSQMGVNTWAAFAGSDENAFVDGDFAMLESEVQGVLNALRKAGINIVAIHNHMSGEEPRYVFLHYWGKGRARELAKAVKSALDTQTK